MMRVKVISIVFMTGLLFVSSLLFSQQPDFKALEAAIEKVAKKVSSATVAVTAYDSSNDRTSGATFSAVVISPDGIILSAAHAVKTNQIYKIVFPDGRQTTARGLGSMEGNDAAVLKIIGQGTWPYAEMGWSSTLNQFEPCISLGYPQNMRQSGPPLLRLGYITESTLNPGFLCNTALMEPGDSGGPLFDLNGRVIGIHSRVSQSMDANFEIPVDEFRKNWSKLLNTGDHQFSSPFKSKNMQETPVKSGIKPVRELEKIDESFLKLSSPLKSASVSITSRVNNKETAAQGTAIFLTNEGQKNNSYIISKSSIVGDAIFVSYESKSLPAIVIARDSLNDLVLLKINTTIKDGINILSGLANINNYDAGKFLISPFAGNEPAKVSVMSSPRVSFLPYRWNATLRFKAVERKNQLRIEKIEANSVAKMSNLKVGDRIVSLNGVPINTNDELEYEISTYRPNNKVRFKGKRYGFNYSKLLLVENMGYSQPQQEHLAEQFQGGKSIRNYGFKKMFSHDGKLLPSECGSPVFDLDGNFMGINIARVSRTSSIAIPAEEVRNFVQSALKLSTGN